LIDIFLGRALPGQASGEEASRYVIARERQRQKKRVWIASPSARNDKKGGGVR
jgi:hypothetical protein